MLISMTGFGRGEYISAQYALTVEIKSVNHRYGDISVHMPRFMNGMEGNLRRLLSDTLKRGKIDVYVEFKSFGAGERKVVVDKFLLESYYEILEEIARKYDLSLPREVQELTGLAGMVAVEEAAPDLQAVEAALQQAAAQALADIQRQRLAEGANIAKDFLYRLDLTGKYVDEIAARKQESIKRYEQRLRDKLAELTADGGIDETRLLQEIVLYADRIDYTEEVVRLRSHLQQFVGFVQTAEVPIGRKIDFLLQEINREINTISSKAADIAVLHIVVEVKNEVEKMREQIQNIE